MSPQRSQFNRLALFHLPMFCLHIGWGEYSGPFFMVVKNKEPADHFKHISELHGCMLMQLILVWPFVGPAGYIAGVPLCGSGNTLWHPKQCLQQTSSFTLPCTRGTGIIAFHLYMFTCIGVLSGYIAYLHLGTHVRRPCEPAWYVLSDGMSY